MTKSSRLFSEEVQGQWALDQIEAVLDILKVRNFVIPKDKGEKEIPREEYFEAYLDSKQRTLINIAESQEANTRKINKQNHSLKKFSAKTQELSHLNFFNPCTRKHSPDATS
jgi:hypothetical protein